MACRLEKPVKREVEINGKRYHVVLEPRGVFAREVKAVSRKWSAISWDGLIPMMTTGDWTPTALQPAEDVGAVVDAADEGSAPQFSDDDI